MPRKIRVLLADDHPVFRTGVRTLLETDKSIEIVGETSKGARVIPLVGELKPDVLVLDMEMPDLGGVEIARQLRSAKAPVRVLALSAHDDVQYVRNLIETGAAGYLMKDENPERIIEAIKGVARGEEGWISRRVAARMEQWAQNEFPARRTLTERELDVLQQIVNGLSNQEIGRRLHISEKTVEKHSSSIFSKLNVNSRVEAAVLAVQEGLV